MPSLKTIAWDVDDVLNNLMRAWFEEKWLIDHPECNLLYEGLTENPPHRLLETNVDNYLKSLDEYRLSALYQKMEPVKEVADWFNKWGDGFRHIALTAVPLIAASASAQWVFRHFGVWIRTFHFVPSKREGQNITEYEKDKAGFLEWLEKVDVLVDDNVENVSATEKIGVKGIVIPRPWNQSKRTIAEALAELKNI